MTAAYYAPDEAREIVRRLRTVAEPEKGKRAKCPLCGALNANFSKHSCRYYSCDRCGARYCGRV